MISHQLSTAQLPRLLRACIYAVLLCAFFGVVSDTRAQTKTEVCNALDMSTADCALISRDVSTTLPAGVTLPQEGAFATVAIRVSWRVSSIAATKGANSLRSGAVGHRQGSCLVLAVSLPANTRIRFSLRTESEGQFDRLAFFVDDQTVISNFSAPAGDFDNFIRDWTVLEHHLTSNASNLSWCYLKNGGSFTQGNDAGWLDALSFIPVCPVLDMSTEECALITATRYDPPGVPWAVNSFAIEGANSLRSTPVTHNEQSCLILNVSLPDRTLVQFSRRLDSQPADELYFSVDDVRQEYSLRPAPTTVLRDWSREVHILFESGNRTLRWCYVKDASETEGFDNARLDDLSLVAPPEAPLNRELVCLVLDMSLEDCQLITSYASEPAAPAWYISYFNSEGGTALRSDPEVDDNETSCLVLGVALPGNRNLSFTLRSDSEAVNDFVYFEADGVRLVDAFSAVQNSGVRDFEPLEVLLSGSVNTLKWCYTKNGSGDAGDDSGWVDDLSFSAVDDLATIALTRTLVCQALDLSTEHCALIDSVAAAPPELPWVLSATATEGGLSLRSAPVDDDQTSCLVLGITLPDDRSLRFSLRTDSEAVNDFLYFEADGIRLVDAFTAVAQNSSVRDWEPLDVLIAGSVSSLTWCYTKNDSTSSGEDSGWLDALTFTVLGVTRDPLCTALDMNTADCALITSISTILPPALMLAQQPVDVPWSVASDVSHQGDSALRSGDIDHSEASCLVLGVMLPEGTLIRFALRASAEGAFDHLTFAADSMTVIERFSLPAGASSTPTDFELQEYTTTNPVRNLSWCYQKNADTDMFGDRVWLDTLSFAVPVLLSITQVCAALDLSSDNCSQIQSVSFDPPSLPWLITTDTYVAGTSSLRSGDIGNSQQSCLVLKLTTLPANSVVTVSGRTSSEGGFDQLLIDADPLRLDTLSAPLNQSERGWRQESYFLPTAISTLSWCYTKDGVQSQGQDAAWIDNLSFSTSDIPYQSRICAALDVTENNCSLIQSVSYEPPELLWVITSQTSVAGRTSLRSGDIDGNQTHCLVLGITLPANSVISVAGRTSSQGGLDQLLIAADPLRLDTLSAAQGQVERDWRQESYFLPATISTLRWCYAKVSGADASDGSDAVWIDNLSFSTSNIPYQSRICAALDVTENNCSLIQSVRYEPPELLWVITSQTSVAGRTSLRSGDINDNQGTCIMLELALPAGSVISVAGRTSSEGSSDRLMIAADPLRLDTLSAAADQIERDWRQQSYFLPTAISTLSWCYTKDNLEDRGQDASWIDNLSFSTSNISYQSRICAALDLTASDCSLIQSVTHNPPESLWVITSQTSVAGRTSLRNGAIDHNQSSCVVLELALPANSVISAAGRTSSQGGFDQLQIDADPLRLDTISAPVFQIIRDWRQESYFLPTAISELRWCYTMDGTLSEGQNAAWIDSLSFSTSNISYQSRVCAALDITASDCSLVQSVTYNPPESLWIITSQTSVVGRTSMRSGNVSHDQQSCIVIEVSLPAGAVVSVAGRINSESGFDQLLIDAGGRRLDTIFPPDNQIERGWRQRGYTLPAASSDLIWCYTKDFSRIRGQDAAWIDALAFISTATISVCEPLDLSVDDRCAAIESVTWEPPQNRWQAMTSTASLVGASALVTPPLAAGQSACLIIELASTLPPVNHLIFSWRITSPSEQDMLRFQAGSQQRQISNESEWQTEYIELDSLVTTLSWCYTPDNQDSRAWLDSLLLVTPADRYRVEIAIADGPVPVSTQTETFRSRVEISVESPLLPPPPDWVLLVGGIENIVEADSTFALSFGSSGSTEVVVFSTPQNPLLPATVLLALIDRPSFSGATGTSIRYTLTARELTTLQLLVASTVTQTAAEAPIEIAVEVRAADRFGRPFNPQGLTLNVAAVDNANVPQSSYALSFAGGVAQTTGTVELIRDRSTGRIEIAVTGGEINTTTAVVINPVPPQLASITLSAASNSLVQTMANTAVAAELILTALDNYGNPIGADNVILQLSASLDAIFATTLTVAIETSGTTRQLVEVLPQNDLDTTPEYSYSCRGGLWTKRLQLLPEGGIQIAVRALRCICASCMQ